MATVSDYITEALQDLGVIAQNEAPSADDAAFALTRFLRFTDQLKTQRFSLFRVARTTWTINANDGSYSIGTGGDINVMRPVFVDRVGYLRTDVSPVLELPLTPLTDQMYQAISLKTLTSPYPTSWYYNRTVATGTLELWPVPTTALSGVIYTPIAVDEFTALSDSLILPPGYHTFFVSNLALALAAGFERQPSPMLARDAQMSRTQMESSNVQMSDLGVDSAVRSRKPWYNILRDS